MIPGTYTATDLVTILAAVGVLAASIGGVIVQIITALRTERKVDAQTATLGAVKTQSDIIETHVNSAAAAAAAKIESLQQELRMMRAALADKREAAALLAQAAAHAAGAASVAPSEPTPPAKVEPIGGPLDAQPIPA